jgi:2-polyprenyl-6-methoxyphenol hydroxylase-like FAD-dependent oxidoreductase/pimeloyl-ACP methyl ester carboxylesterase
MTAGPDYDVAIVGASVAGCTAATLFGRRGLRVALLDRETRADAYKKICTHFIQASATPTLERLGLAERIEAAGGVRNGIQMWTRWGWIRPSLDDVYPFPRYGYNLRRQTLDPMLRELAAGTTGVTFLPGHVARGLRFAGRQVAGVDFETAAGQRSTVTARLVVAADGRNSGLSELAKAPATVKPHNRFGYFAYYADAPLATGAESQMWLLEPNVAYAFPNDGGLTLLAAFIEKSQLPAWKLDVAETFTRFFEGLPVGPDMHAARRVSEFLGMLNMPNVAHPPAFRGMALVGDAALASDPLWGVGCGWALQSAEWLVNATADALLAGTDTKPGLQAYAKRHRAGLAGHDFLITDYATGRAFNPIERLMFSAAAKDTGMANHVAAFGSRSIGATQFLAPLAVARAIWTNVRRPSAMHNSDTGLTTTASGLRHLEIQVAGLRSRVIEAGPPGADEAVVFVHGNPGSSRDWEDLASRVGAFGRSVAIDMPGFGRADKPRDFTYTVAGYAQHLGRCLDTLGIRRAHLVLHDFGGPWGLSFAADHPDAVGSLTLINTGVLLDYHWHYLARIWQTPVVGEVFMATTTRVGFHLLLKHGNPRGLPRAFVDGMYANFDPATRHAVLALYRATRDPASDAQRLAQALQARAWPVLVVWGTRDPYIPASYAERQRQVFPSAKVVRLENSGHWPFADDPNGVAAAVVPFLRDQLKVGIPEATSIEGATRVGP